MRVISHINSTVKFTKNIVGKIMETEFNQAENQNSIKLNNYNGFSFRVIASCVCFSLFGFH